MVSFIRSIGYHYDRWFRKSPLLTLAIANALCSILGDSAAQLISIWGAETDQLINFDYGRLLRYLLYGLNMGPISGKWNELLEKRFPARPQRSADPSILSEKPPSPIELIEINSTISTGPLDDLKSHSAASPTTRTDPSARLDLTTIFKMVLTDQLVMAPLSLIYFICFMGFAEGNTWEVIYLRVNRLFLKLLLANWQVWPIIQLINFKFMPLRLRVPFSAVCGIVWTIFLSYASTWVSLLLKPGVQLSTLTSLVWEFPCCCHVDHQTLFCTFLSRVTSNFFFFFVGLFFQMFPFTLSSSHCLTYIAYPDRKSVV